MRTHSRIALALTLTLVTGCARGGNESRTVIQNKGSDTLVNVAQAWAEAYREVNPNTAVAVTGGGSGTGIAALINGTVDIANASRQMKPEEIELAKEHGHNPVEFIVGYDALAIFLNPANPITEITIAQLRDIYGESGSAEKWTDLGITVPGCKDQEIVRVSRQNNSGTYAYFQEDVLGEGNDFRLGSRDMHGSKDVVDLVANTACAIGYSGLAYATEEVHMPCVSKDGGECVAPSTETAVDGTYPIARPLFMYTENTPQGEVKQYMDWILSDAGQCLIQEKGYAPARPVSCGN
ncbi:MAG: phosphate ABC transporter substrate-binding protein [Bacteroidetes bacterium]|nr:phosphate ABC transporter substrate-binding protein [Bacteroidota bacterium]